MVGGVDEATAPIKDRGETVAPGRGDLKPILPPKAPAACPRRGIRTVPYACRAPALTGTFREAPKSHSHLTPRSRVEATPRSSFSRQLYIK